MDVVLHLDLTIIFEARLCNDSGGKYGISRGTFFQGIEIVALTTVRATI